MKYTLISDNQSLRHLVKSDDDLTSCGLPFTSSQDYWDVEEIVYNKNDFEEAVAEYLSEELCKKCFPESTATFETGATIVSEEEASEFVEPVKGVRI